MPGIRYSGYPKTLVYKEPGKTPVQQLIWGDWLRLTDKPGGPAGWVSVRARGVDGWMKDADIQTDRLLEVIFVDIGQGDGALVVTPDDKHMLVDAGQEDNMFRYLRWRYGKFETPFDFEAMVISHPDLDHYGGFKHVLGNANVRVGTIYHNGIVERAVGGSLGPKAGGYLTDVVATQAQLATLLGDPAVRGGRTYPNMLFDALQSGRVGDIRAVSRDDGHLPGYAPGQDAKGLVIQVLGPARDMTADGSPTLKWFGDEGKTKNGHSVALRLVYGDISILLGGDLNVPAEHHLLSKHTGYASPPKRDEDRDRLLEGARKVFRSDVAKACHHGSADFTDLYLQAVDPLVTVISSGDNEPHAHPRADAIGAVGRWGRGRRPLVFSTELARSAPERIVRPDQLRRDLNAAYAAVAAAPVGEKKAKAEAKLEKLMKALDRSVAVYGAINLRTDGKKILMAQRVEKAKGVSRKWDTYQIEPDHNGILRYGSKHDE